MVSLAQTNNTNRIRTFIYVIANHNESITAVYVFHFLYEVFQLLHTAMYVTNDDVSSIIGQTLERSNDRPVCIVVIAHFAKLGIITINTHITLLKV